MSLLLKSLTRLDTRPLAVEPEATEQIPSAGPLVLDLVAQVETVAVESESQYSTAEGEVATSPIEIAFPDYRLSPSEFQVPLQETATSSQPQIETPSTQASAPLETLTQLERLLAVDIDQPPHSPQEEPEIHPSQILQQIPSPPIDRAGAASQADATLFPTDRVAALAPTVRQEYRELRDHLLTRFTLQQHATLLFVDAGRVVTDASWLAPLAVSLLEYLTTQRKAVGSNQPSASLPIIPPRVLLVEAAGADSKIARSMGLDARQGLAEVLRGEIQWPATLQGTFHPNLQFLSAGVGPLKSNQLASLTNRWLELKQQFDALLIAAGPISDHTRFGSSALACPANAFFSLADAGILCVELNATPKFAAESAKRALTAARVNVLGCVVRG